MQFTVTDFYKAALQEQKKATAAAIEHKNELLKLKNRQAFMTETLEQKKFEQATSNVEALEKVAVLMEKYWREEHKPATPQ